MRCKQDLVGNVFCSCGLAICVRTSALQWVQKFEVHDTVIVATHTSNIKPQIMSIIAQKSGMVTTTDISLPSPQILH